METNVGKRLAWQRMVGLGPVARKRPDGDDEDQSPSSSSGDAFGNSRDAGDEDSGRDDDSKVVDNRPTGPFGKLSAR